ncbi:flagellar assembly peptidoglycan hydrolase FlgJ [Granulosicoccus sp. 3-233]|uniref:flagellar assembly peptidoglycan hydrolase FlgJ n=1 Tax=Granulosicoccus sp. 3-233 TaxID=3417969 RepID=UPI003D334D9B
MTDLSALIQVQRSSADIGRLQASDSRVADDAEQAKARDAANKFESLLIHSMLKSMRKTTMAENTSNQQALYDDMLDKNLADSMIKAGGLGIADQLMGQLGGKTSKSSTDGSVHTGNHANLTRDRLKLRELALSLKESPPDSGKETQTAVSTTQAMSAPEKGLARLKLLSRLWGQGDDSPADSGSGKTEFLQSLAPHAQRSARRLGTSPSAILAIAALETGWGQSMLKDASGQSSNNYFGIKAGADDQNFTSNTTTEYFNGKSQNVEARFKSYNTTADSVEGFADFLLENPRYSTALQHAGNPERFLRELHDAGYATDPRYADKAISVMHQVEQHRLQP